MDEQRAWFSALNMATLLWVLPLWSVKCCSNIFTMGVATSTSFKSPQSPKPLDLSLVSCSSFERISAPQKILPVLSSGFGERSTIKFRFLLGPGPSYTQSFYPPPRQQKAGISPINQDFKSYPYVLFSNSNPYLPPPGQYLPVLSSSAPLALFQLDQNLDPVCYLKDPFPRGWLQPEHQPKPIFLHVQP